MKHLLEQKQAQISQKEQSFTALSQQLEQIEQDLIQREKEVIRNAELNQSKHKILVEKLRQMEDMERLLNIKKRSISQQQQDSANTNEI